MFVTDGEADTDPDDADLAGVSFVPPSVYLQVGTLPSNTLEDRYDAATADPVDLDVLAERLLQAPPVPSATALALHGPLAASADRAVFPPGLRAATQSILVRRDGAGVRRLDLHPSGPYGGRSTS
ncbi:MAG: hypothetical protein AAF602_10950 [Myxococcota bacterium]